MLQRLPCRVTAWWGRCFRGLVTVQVDGCVARIKLGEGVRRLRCLFREETAKLQKLRFCRMSWRHSLCSRACDG